MSMIERPANSARVRLRGAPAWCACQWRSTVLVTYSMIENITGPQHVLRAAAGVEDDQRASAGTVVSRSSR